MHARSSRIWAALVTVVFAAALAGCECDGNCQCSCVDQVDLGSPTGERLCQTAFCSDVDDENGNGSTNDDCAIACELRTSGACCRVGGSCFGC
jgi:hypothetical protein